MIPYIISILILLWYINVVRFTDLAQNTNVYCWKDYWNYGHGATYVFNILFIILAIINYVTFSAIFHL